MPQKPVSQETQRSPHQKMRPAAWHLFVMHYVRCFVSRDVATPIKKWKGGFIRFKWTKDYSFKWRLLFYTTYGHVKLSIYVTIRSISRRRVISLKVRKYVMKESQQLFTYQIFIFPFPTSFRSDDIIRYSLGGSVPSGRSWLRQWDS